MNSFNQAPEFKIYEDVTIPSGLRTDEKALTYIEESAAGVALGNIYLAPIAPHDYHMTGLLIDKGLSVGRLTQIDNIDRDVIEYGVDTDFIPLASILNSSSSLEIGKKDIADSLVMIRHYLQEMYAKTGLNPQDPTLEMFAIDKSNAKVELIAPYSADSTTEPVVNFEKLKQDILNRSSSEEELNAVVDSFALIED
jgi:hypothetical protein